MPTRSALADEEAPDWLITLATLTGAARVALGPDLPPLYTDDEDSGRRRARQAGLEIGDPLWRMPLWAPLRQLLKSKIADVNHIAEGSYAGSVMAALFLKRFVTKAKRFAHLDIFGWVPREQPGRPQGGEPQAAARSVRLFRATSSDGDQRRDCPIRAATRYRDDLAAASLKDRVEAPRYVEGEQRQVAASRAAAAQRAAFRRDSSKARRCSARR